SRRLPIRVRPDLRARRQRYQGRSYWVVKDPVALQYFRFEEEEFAILQMLDGESSLDQIAEQFEAEFPPQTIRTEELQQFLGMLHRSGLVLADAAGQGVQLKKRRDERKHKERLAMASNVLSVRFKGFDPERLLNAMYAFPPVRWFFSWPVFIGCMVMCLAALLLVLVNFDAFQARLPSFQAYFSAQNWTNWLILGVVLSVTKVLHEFGHGLSCKHFGGECHEMGVMFLVLTPCLYCNVSDSWMLPSRWKRAAIGAAGMYVEVVLAAVCTFVWWFTDSDTLLNKLCLNVMFISSVSTILFNANPLLRYDGYYILSDLLEIPNLRQKAQQILSRTLGEWCLGLEPPEDPFLPKRNQGWFALYTVASAAYRWVVVLSICYFLNVVFEPYGLKVLGQLVALTAVWGLVGQPLWKLYKYFKVPGRLSKVKRWRLWTSVGVAAAAVAGVATIPFPAAVHCTALVQPRDAATVYVEALGVLDSVSVEAGQRVEAGDELARLVNVDIELAIARLESQIAEYQIKLADLRAMSFTDSTAAEQTAQVAELLAATREQLAQYRRDARRLVLRAPVAGVVIPPPA
ncbi:MAG: site-2 protease family protein, partial [Planctomycetota bacterium]